MESNLMYLVVVKKLVNKKYLIRFPDFEDLLTAAEEEKNIKKIATNVLTMKIQELKNLGIEVPIPKEIDEVRKLLQEDEYIIYIKIDANVENEKSLKFIRINSDKFKKKLKESHSFLGIIGGLIFFISPFLPVLSVNKLTIRGIEKIKIDFFNIYALEKFYILLKGSNIKQDILIIRILLFLMAISGFLVIYNTFYKKYFYLIKAILISIFLFVIKFGYIFFKFASFNYHGGIYIEFSYGWFIVALLLMLFPLTYAEDQDEIYVKQRD